MKTDKVVKITDDGTYKDMPKWKVQLEKDGEYTFFAKFDAKVGDTIRYQVNNEKYKTAKVLGGSSPGAGSSNTNEMIIRQTCIKASAEFNAQSSASIDDLLEDAQRMYDWIKK